MGGESSFTLGSSVLPGQDRGSDVHGAREAIQGEGARQKAQEGGSKQASQTQGPHALPPRTHLLLCIPPE